MDARERDGDCRCAGKERADKAGDGADMRCMAAWSGEAAKADGVGRCASGVRETGGLSEIGWIGGLGAAL